MKNEDQDQIDQITEEEIQEFLENNNKNNKSKKSIYTLVFLLHSNYFFHFVLAFLINLVMAAVSTGFLSFLEFPVIHFDLVSFIIAIILFTLVENLLKILLYRYFLKYFILSFGTLTVLLHILIFWGLEVILQPNFFFHDIQSLIIFNILFAVLRFMLATYVKSIFMPQTIRRTK